MSTESFKAFAARLREDPGLQDEVRSASGDEGISVETLAALAEGYGFHFTVEDVSNELSDAQLEGVAGGLGRTTIPKVLISPIKWIEGTAYVTWDG